MARMESRLPFCLDRKGCIRGNVGKEDVLVVVDVV
jgi:hypothetical protein